MCDICKKLLNVPVGEKRTVFLYESNSIGAIADETKMIVDNGGKPEAFITNRVVLEDDRTYQHPIFISYCPFCGEKLV